MTKYAINTPAQGGGKLTLNVPVTEEDRELEFPDAGGTLHSSEGPNDFGEMPTVNGDPVVESGSNSDGEWTRWADGTQICSFVDGGTSTLSSSNGGFQYSGIVTWSFPVPFVDTPIVNPGAYRSEGNILVWGSVRTSVRPDVSAGLSAVSAEINSITTRAVIYANASGRWK